MESIVDSVGNAIYLIFTAPLLAVFGFMYKKTNNTYTKLETDKQIELRTLPMKELLDRNTKAIDDLADKTDEMCTNINTTLISIKEELAETRTDRKQRRRIFDEPREKRNTSGDRSRDSEV